MFSTCFLKLIKVIIFCFFLLPSARTMKVQVMVEESSDDLKHLLENPKELLDLVNAPEAEEISIPLPEIEELTTKKQPGMSFMFFL